MASVLLLTPHQLPHPATGPQGKSLGGRFFLNNTNPHHSNRHSDGDPYHFPLGTTFASTPTFGAKPLLSVFVVFVSPASVVKPH